MARLMAEGAAKVNVRTPPSAPKTGGFRPVTRP